MFDAAHAALLRHGAGTNPAETRTHGGLIGTFGKHLVKTGLVGAKWGRLLNQIEHLRLIVDYTGEPIEPNKARWVVRQATEFVETMQRGLRDDESAPL